MAVYKVIQDVESEDKLLGPLTLKGFVYAAIAFTCAFIEFKLIFIGTPLKWLFVLLFAMPMVLFGVLASPLGREQPTEVWLLSRIRFFFKPRQRIWDQEGINELVTITAPKNVEKQLTDGLSPTEVQSRLKVLAQTLDTRGWAVKNVDVNLNTPENEVNVVTPESDRLVGGAGVPQQMPVVDVHAEDDIMDEKNNPTAQKFEAMMQKADTDRRKGLLSKLRDMVDGDEETEKAGRPKGSKDLPATKAALAKLRNAREEELGTQRGSKQSEMQKKLAEARARFAAEHGGAGKSASRHKILSQTAKAETKPKTEKKPAADPAVTAARQTVNMELAQSGNAFSVATLSRLANRQPAVEQTGPNEVTISLH